MGCRFRRRKKRIAKRFRNLYVCSSTMQDPFGVEQSEETFFCSKQRPYAPGLAARCQAGRVLRRKSSARRPAATYTSRPALLFPFLCCSESCVRRTIARTVCNMFSAISYCIASDSSKCISYSLYRISDVVCRHLLQMTGPAQLGHTAPPLTMNKIHLYRRD